MFVSHGFSTSVQHPLATWPYATYAAQGACGGFGHERPWKLRLKVIPQEGCCFPMEFLGDILGLGGCLSNFNLRTTKHYLAISLSNEATLHP